MSNISTLSLKNQNINEVRIDKRDITVPYEKIQRELGFQTQQTLDDDAREVLQAIHTGLIRYPGDQHYWNTRFVVH